MRHGEMTEEEAAVHPQRHILTRALGVSSEVDADMWELELRTGDRVLLCSDGLSNEVGTDEMADVLREVDDPEEAARRLVEVANEHGGADNITVVIVDVQVGEDGDGAAAKVRAARARCRGARRALRGDGRGPGRGTGARTGSRRRGRRPADATGLMRVGHRHGGHGRGRAWTTPWRPGAQLGFGDEHDAGGEGPRSDEFFLGAATSVPVARSTTRVPPRPCRRAGGAGGAQGEGEPGRAAATPRHPAPHHAPGRRVHPAGGRRAGGRVLRVALVRLRQLDRDAAGRPDRGQAGPAGRCALVPPEGRGPDGSHDGPDLPRRRRRRCKPGCQRPRSASARNYVAAPHDDHDHDDHHPDDHDDVPPSRRGPASSPSRRRPPRPRRRRPRHRARPRLQWGRRDRARSFPFREGSQRRLRAPCNRSTTHASTRAATSSRT